MCASIANCKISQYTLNILHISSLQLVTNERVVRFFPFCERSLRGGKGGGGKIGNDLSCVSGRHVNYTLHHQDISFALLWKMATSSELSEYSSPSKRRKVDDIGYKASPGLKLDFRSDKQLDEHQSEDLEGILPKIWTII